MERICNQRWHEFASGLLRAATLIAACQANAQPGRWISFAKDDSADGAGDAGALHPAVLEENRPVSVTNWSHAIAQQLLHRYGVVFRETGKCRESAGRIFGSIRCVEGDGRERQGAARDSSCRDLGATQFAIPAALDMLRSLRTTVDSEKTEMLVLAATDPANPYGTLLRWPVVEGDTVSTLTRSVGARVVLCNGALAAYLRRANPNLQLFLAAEEPMRSQTARSVAHFLAELGQRMFALEGSRSGLLISTINGTRVAEHLFGKFLLDAGFQIGPMGFNLRRA